MCALTRDHKPSCKDEAKRVMREGGRIEPYKDPNTGEFIGPLRVWLKEQPVPGLAMTRSIGDDKGTSVGVDYRPGIYKYIYIYILLEINVFLLYSYHKFIIIASDGVWEFLNNFEVSYLISIR